MTILKNNWFRTNIEDWHKDINSKIEYTYDAGDFIPSNFADAAKKIALEIQAKYEHIYVAYSGGMDSEYVVRLFHENNIKFTPVCAWPAATRSIRDAYKVCEELNIKPITIKLNDDDIWEIIKEMNIKTYSIINQPAVYAVCKLAKKLYKDAIVVTGETAMDSNDRFRPQEQQQYNNLITKYKDMILPFFYYNQHIIYELIVGIADNRYTKEKFYNIPWRRKIKTINYITENLNKKVRNYYEIIHDGDEKIHYFKILPSKLLK